MYIFQKNNKIFRAVSNILKVSWKPSFLDGMIFWSNSEEKNLELQNSKVAKWVDISGNMNHGLQLNDITRPLFQKNVINDNNGIYFDYKDNIKIKLKLDNFTIISVVDITNDDFFYELENSFNVNGSSSQSISVDKAPNYSRKNTNNSTWLADGSTYKIIQHQYNGTHLSHKLYINNQYVSMTSSYDDDPGNLEVDGFLTFGSNVAVDNGIIGHVFELMIFDRALSNEEKDQVSNFLNTKYNCY